MTAAWVFASASIPFIARRNDAAASLPVRLNERS